VSVCADDGTNVEITLKARDLVRFRKGQLLTAYCHIVDLELCNLLSGEEITADKNSRFRLEFFNLLKRGARLMLKVKKIKTVNRQPRIVIIGLGKMGRSLAVQAAWEWWIKEKKKNGRRLHISVIDKAAKKKVELLLLQYPQLDRACKFDIYEMEKNSPEFEQGDFLFDSKGRCNVDAIYICFDDDAHAMVNALALYRKTKDCKVPIIVRISQNTGLATLIREDSKTFDYSRLHIFGLLDRTCSMETLLGGTHEILARAIHEDYVRHQKEDGKTIRTNPSIADWKDLPEDLKESNRDQADCIKEKLKAVDCAIQLLTDWNAVSFEFLPEEIELLAKMEHKRWCKERKLQGWIHKPGPKDIKKKSTPYLVSWEVLPEDIREYDRNTVRNLPSFLAQAGFQIYRKV
jgi:hypothetical protein